MCDDSDQSGNAESENRQSEHRLHNCHALLTASRYRSGGLHRLTFDDALRTNLLVCRTYRLQPTHHNELRSTACAKALFFRALATQGYD
jgi:hypothetical protein